MNKQFSASPRDYLNNFASWRTIVHAFQYAS